VSLVRRFRRSTGVARLQLKWLTTAAAILAVVYLLAMIASIGTTWGTQDTPTWVSILQNLSTLAFLLIPVSIGFAILKHRLYEIDVVINKTVVYGAMAAFITAAYVVMVVGIGALIGRGSEPNLPLSILATAVVAVAFGPVKQRVQHLANRLVYGKRSTPYEVLSQFSGRMAGALATEDALPTLAHTLAEATGAETAEVWLAVRDELQLGARWPAGDPRDPLTVPSGRMPEPGPGGLATPVRHQGRTLGCLVVRRASGDPVTPAETKLVGDLAAQAGLVLRNVGLIEDLRASRQRLVAAQDSERRRLERNIHDGAQQRLVALAVRFNLAQRLARNGQAEVMARLGAQTQSALENLRDLARGIYPPLLADQGLMAALQAQAAKVPVPTRVEASGVGRYPQEVEAAVYFCCLEALQNVAKYAQASRVEIRLRDSEGELTIEVEDDGVGFDPAGGPRGSGLTNMQDRLAVAGGSLEVRSRLGEGTTVSGRVRVRPLEGAVA
jgi:signal transduction histidine kinase